MSAFAMSAVAPATIAAPARRVAPAASARSPPPPPPIALHASRRETGFEPETDLGSRPHRHLSHRRSLRLQGEDPPRVLLQYALVHARVIVEVRWLKLASIRDRRGAPLSDDANQFSGFLANFSPADAAEVKKVERTTNHDVKAVGRQSSRTASWST